MSLYRSLAWPHLGAGLVGCLRKGILELGKAQKGGGATGCDEEGVGAPSLGGKAERQLRGGDMTEL